MVMSFAYSQTPIIRLLQSREYKTPKFWWRDQVTHNLRTYLADDTSTPAYKNNNFDAWQNRTFDQERQLKHILKKLESSAGQRIISNKKKLDSKINFLKEHLNIEE